MLKVHTLQVEKMRKIMSYCFPRHVLHLLIEKNTKKTYSYLKIHFRPDSDYHWFSMLPLCFSFMAPLSFQVRPPTVQTRTSPSPPPLMICFLSLVVATAVTPIW